MTTSHAQPVDVFVCITCQQAGAAPDAERAGVALHRNLLQEAGADIRLHPVECLAVCKRPCTVAVSSAGKWTYVIGDLDAAQDVPALLDYLKIYAASPSGTPSLKERPAAIRRGTIVRIPTHLSIPSPLVGEGGEGGALSAIESVESFPPTLTLPHKGGGN